MIFNEMFLIVILMILLIINYNIKLSLQIEVLDKNIKAMIQTKLLFGKIKLNKQLYPPKKKKKKFFRRMKEINENIEERNIDTKKLVKVILKNINDILDALLIIKLDKVFSKIKFGSENLSLTSYIYIVINVIYSNLINLIKCQNINLKVEPSYLKSCIEINIKIDMHIKIKDIIFLVFEILKIYMKNRHYFKEEENERNGINSKSYGNNS